jgi:ribosomal protein S18 acetylase RimI-like enzyme
LFEQVYLEAVHRAGGDLTVLAQPSLLNLQFESQRNGYASAYPLACHYVVSVHPGEAQPIGRMIIDWTGDGPVAGIDLAVLPTTRRGAVGLHLLRSWLATCDHLRRAARLHVMPENPARRIYRKLGFVEDDALAFPVPMLRRPRAHL